jgi:hypothetical protein
VSPGFGSGPFGQYSFGEWPWSLFTLVYGIPSVYREQDDLSGAGSLRALLEGIVPSLDGLRQRIRDYDQLRDPLLAPIDTDFDVNVIVIRTDDQGDGTSIVFLSEGPDGDKFIGIRPGMVLIDLIGNRFTIDSVHSSALPIDVDNPPTDPATLASTGRHIIVSNIGQASTELIPFASSTLIVNESPSPVGAVGNIVAIAKALLVDGVDFFTLKDGAHGTPFSVFEFDTVPNGVTLGRIAVDVSLAVTAVDVASAMVEAINTAPNLNLTASNGLGTLATVTITNFGAGAAGNIIWSENVTNPGFILTQPTGGAAGAFVLDPLGFDNGVSLAPYVFNRAGAALNGPAIAPNRVEITWTEGGVQKNGFFTAEGLPGGDLADASTLNRTTTAPVLAAGQFSLYNDSGAVIDADSIQVTYTLTPAVQLEDSEIRAQNILAFLASDYGIKLDRNDPEFLQRSYVNNAFKIWDVKGTELGYDVLGQYAGYFVSAQPLYAITASVAAGLESSFVFELPEGDPATGSIVAIPFVDIIDGETFTLDDGVNAPVTFEFDTVPDGVTPGNVVVDISGSTTALDVANEIVAAINSASGLELTASNGGSTLTTVTILNAENGTFGNVTTWSETVADVDFIITQPTGGIDSDLFTTINPGRALFDDVALDSIPLDLLCSDAAFPQTTQVVTVTSAVKIRDEGSNKRTLVTATTATPYLSFGTDGVLTDFSGSEFDIDEFTRVNATTLTFEVVSLLLPVVGVGSIAWSVFKFEPIQASGTLTLTLIPSNNETVTVGVVTYTFKTALTPLANEVLIGASAGAALSNLHAAITLGVGAGTVYAAATLAHPTVTAVTPIGLTMTVIALVGGLGGNSIPISETLINGSFGGPVTLLGGLTQNSLSIVGLGTDVIDLGVQYVGYTGHRYRITQEFVDPPLAGIGNWSFIDNDGVVSYIERFQASPTLLMPDAYQFEIISATVPAAGIAHIFYRCELVTTCDFCRASSILVKISPTTIIDFPEALEGDALSRLLIRLTQMIPAHVRIAAFIYDPGPATATWGPIAASSTIIESWTEDGLYTAYYDEDEYPADELPTDGAPITASSEVTITNQNVLEEYLVGPDPLIAATWTGTGLWQTTEYDSSTSFRSFNYGDEDVGTVTPPNYDIGAFVTSGTLTSPTVNIPAATTVLLKFRHFGDMLAGGADDVVSVLVVDEAPLSTVQTITKTDLGLFATGTNGGFTSFSVPISPAVIGIGNFHLEFVFNSVSLTTGRGALQGWYVDDIEIQVIP